MQNLDFLKKQPLIKTMHQIKRICEENNVDQSHGLPHAVEIGLHVKKALDSMNPNQKLTTQQQQEVLLGALLHDIDDHKYFKTQNFSNARNILKFINLDSFRSEKIIRMIQLVSFSKNGNNIYQNDPIHYYFPRYADRVEAIGLIGIYRTHQYSQRVNSPFYSQNTARPKTKEQIYSIMQGRDQIYIQRGGSSDSSIDHIFDKLLHIKLPTQITNPYLQKLYSSGHQYMIDFVLKHSQNGYKDSLQDLLLRVKEINSRKMTEKQILDLVQSSGQ